MKQEISVLCGPRSTKGRYPFNHWAQRHCLSRLHVNVYARLHNSSLLPLQCLIYEEINEERNMMILVLFLLVDHGGQYMETLFAFVDLLNCPIFFRFVVVVAADAFAILSHKYLFVYLHTLINSLYHNLLIFYFVRKMRWHVRRIF